MKKTLIAGAILAASIFSTAALADAPQYYLWGDVGTSNTSSYNDYFPESERDLDNNMYGMGFGLTFNQDMFAEFGYQSLGTSEFSGYWEFEEGGVDHTTGGDNFKNEHEAIVARLGKLYSWNPHVAFSVHLGGAYVRSETSGTLMTFNEMGPDPIEETRIQDKETNVIGMAGIGFNFKLTDNLDARVRFERMVSVKSSYDTYHMDNLTAGLAYRF